jgi:hypothetical protein
LTRKTRSRAFRLRAAAACSRLCALRFGAQAVVGLGPTYPHPPRRDKLARYLLGALQRAEHRPSKPPTGCCIQLQQPARGVSQNLAWGRLQEAARKRSESKNELTPKLAPLFRLKGRSALNTTTSKNPGAARAGDPSSRDYARTGTPRSLSRGQLVTRDAPQPRFSAVHGAQHRPPIWPHRSRTGCHTCSMSPHRAGTLRHSS